MSIEHSPSVQAQTNREIVKPIHTILLDTSPILLNTPSISTLIANSHALVTTQSVLDEIRGEEARNRLETLYKPFITVRSPRLESVKLVKDFARKTGDSGVLSATDFEILALAYDLECERNGGDWRLRSTPRQKRLNGSPPRTLLDASQGPILESNPDEEQGIEERMQNISVEEPHDVSQSQNTTISSSMSQDGVQSDISIPQEPGLPTVEDPPSFESPAEIVNDDISSDSDEGWITLSNVKKYQAKEDAASSSTKSENKVLQVATITGDFAMQNVLLQMNLNLLSTKTCKRVSNIKQMILRCHACFATTKDMSKQFCPRCGGPTLTRVTCTTNDRGEVKLHLKANHQWNNRGNVFSVPKPTSGTANQKWKGPQQGGGKGGWGNDLILAEDQKEYVRAVASARRTKIKDLMDEDVLPSIITGDRDRGGGRIKVGAGRSINSRKR